MKYLSTAGPAYKPTVIYDSKYKSTSFWSQATDA